jgi:hypothetical protein
MLVMPDLQVKSFLTNHQEPLKYCIFVTLLEDHHVTYFPIKNYLDDKITLVSYTRNGNWLHH